MKRKCNTKYLCVCVSTCVCYLCVYVVFTAVGIDAMEIYTTYVALNATNPVGIPAEIRQRIEGI